jgi:hypothetical protein
MAGSGKATAWVAVKVELEPCEVWADDLPCTQDCSYEHEHEIMGECTESCGGDCDVDHPDYTERCTNPRCAEVADRHPSSDGHRPDWNQAGLSRAMLEELAKDYESAYDVLDPETNQYVRAGDLRVGPERVEAWRWKAVPGTAQIIARIEPAVTPAVTDRPCACGCGRPVTSPRPEAKYASGACRVRAHRAK